MPNRRGPRWWLALVAVAGLCAGGAHLAIREIRYNEFLSGPPPIARGPQIGSVTSTSARIAWRTDPASESWIRFRDGADRSDASPVASKRKRGVEHVETIDGLKPGAKYAYAVICDGKQTGPEHTFTTAPEAPAPFRFAALGDSGSGSDDQIRIAAQILEWAPDFVIHTGDVVYPHGDPDDFDEDYFHPYRRLIDHVPFYLCLGNHDVEYDGGRALLEAVPLPTNDRTKTSEFYSWDWSNAHFVALDTELTYQVGSPQYEWLKDDLGKTAAPWKIVFFHHPPYTSSRSQADAGVITKLCPLFEMHHVDLVLSGHDHQYERTFPMVQAKPVGATADPNYVNPPGPIYVVTGGGGKSLYESGHKEFTAFSKSAYHHTRVEISGGALTLTAVGTDGALFDEVTIRKTN